LGVSLRALEAKSITGGRNVLVKFAVILILLKVEFTTIVTVIRNNIPVDFTPILILIEIKSATKLKFTISFISVVVDVGITAKLGTVLYSAVIT